MLDMFTLWAVLALSNGVSTAVAVATSIAGFITAVVGFLIYRDNKNTKNNKKNIDLLTIGQGSLKAALDRADQENEDLRQRLASAEATIDVLREQITHLTNELTGFRMRGMA